MPPKKALETAPSGKTDTSVYKPEEIQFFVECLKAIDDDGVMDISALCKAAGHTNPMSTRNAWNRYKKRYGFGNIPTKTGDATETLKPKNTDNKVGKKRGRPATKNATETTPATPAQAIQAEDEDEDGKDGDGNDDGFDNTQTSVIVKDEEGTETD